ncbi:MAG: sensor histidine kinase [Sphingobacteriaceae bacterium]|nr:sensor histidine kinase [Sphingobacteriaceae bacterium]
MSGKSKISVRIFVLSLISCILSVVAFLTILKIGRFNVDLTYFLLSLFIYFVVSIITLYYFYFIDIASKINELSAKIKSKFLYKELPKARNQLEEIDSLADLDEQVDELILSREKELLQIKNLDSYRKEYIGNVSHELKTPVFNIQGYVDTLIHGGLHDDSINMEYLKRTEKSIDRLINIIDDLETITQLETGDLNLEKDNFDIAVLTKDIYAALEMSAAKKKIKLELAKKYDKPILVYADKFRIRQVLVNLITNSIKYGKEDGTTTISFNYLNDDVVVQVKDNGPGIEEKHLARVFERFYRIDKGRSREQGGTGLGLAIVKHIIDVHSKSIKVESVVDKGTTFTFSLEQGT